MRTLSLSLLSTALLSATLAAPARAEAPAKKESPALRDPAQATLTAPAIFKVKFSTTKGDFVVEAHRDWAPLGADRFYNLVKAGYYTDIAFFRCIKGFMVQFGVHGDPTVASAWRSAKLTDDPTGKQSNGRGMITFAMAGPNTRTTQMFINFTDNKNLDSMGFAPFGKVVDMKVVDALEGEYGEGAPRGRGPDQGRVQGEGNVYLKRDFPKLDYIKSATLLP